MSIQDYLLEKKREQERRIRWEMAKRKTATGRKVALGALIGSAAGVIAGVLLAPKSGKETREDLLHAAEDVSKNMRANVNDTIDTIKYKTDELGYELKDKYHEFQDRNRTTLENLEDDEDFEGFYDDQEITYNEDGTICLDGRREQSYVPDEAFDARQEGSKECLDDVEAKAKENMRNVGQSASSSKNLKAEGSVDVEKTEKPYGEPPLSEASSTDTVDTAFDARQEGSKECLDDVEAKAKENMKNVGQTTSSSKNLKTTTSLDVEKTEKPEGDGPLSEPSSRDTVDKAFDAHKKESAECLDEVEAKAKENMKNVSKNSNNNKK